jgi:hypothetical protein
LFAAQRRLLKTYQAIGGDGLKISIFSQLSAAGGYGWVWVWVLVWVDVGVGG